MNDKKKKTTEEKLDELYDVIGMMSESYVLLSHHMLELRKHVNDLKRRQDQTVCFLKQKFGEDQAAGEASDDR
jgi:hypothetical protein